MTTDVFLRHSIEIFLKILLRFLSYRCIFYLFHFSIPTAVALSILYGSIVNIKFDSDNIQTIFRKTTLIFIINTSVTSTAIFFFRTYELLSRFYVLVFFILYPLLILFVEYLAFLLNKIEKLINRLSFASLFVVFFVSNYFLLLDSQENILNENKFEEDVEVDASKIIFQNNVAEEFVLDEEECNE